MTYIINHTKSERERRRIERGHYESERAIARYDSECGECITYRLEPEELNNYKKYKKLK